MNQGITTEYSWAEIRDLVKLISPTFSAIIDEINPDKHHVLYLIKYPYGELVLDKGVFQLPNSKGSVVPITDSTITTKIKDNLTYSGTIPLGLVTKNGFESFSQTRSRILPGAYMNEGRFLSLWRVLEEGYSYYLGPFWSYSSGARSIFMLPKITDSASHKNLKLKYGLKLSAPQNLSDHWKTLVYLANHSNFSQPWSSEVLFFSKKWLEHKTDKRWDAFYRFLLNEVWERSSYRRNQFIFDIVFYAVLEEKNLKPNPYLMDIVKYLFSMGIGSSLGFVPAIDNSAAPIAGLQKIYIEDYELKKYAPVIMHSSYYIGKRPLYYSFQMPLTAFSPKTRRLASVMLEIQETKHVMDTFLSEILKENFGVEKTTIFDLAKTVQYDYYHADKDKISDIFSSSSVLRLENTFAQSLISDEQYLFPEFSQFFRGFVSISAKDFA